MRIQFSIPLLLGLVALLLVGCSDDGVSRSVMEVVSVNDGLPVIDYQRDLGADRTINTADDFVPQSSVRVTVANRVYEASLDPTESEPFGAYLIQRVDVAWQPLAPGTAADRLTAYDHSYPLNEIVRRGTQLELAIVLVSYEMKSQPFLQELVSTDDVIVANAVLTFTGYDTAASNAPYTFGVTVPVEFIGVAAPK